MSFEKSSLRPMHWRGFLLPIVVLFLLGGFLVACGSDDDDTPTPTQPQATGDTGTGPDTGTDTGDVGDDTTVAFEDQTFEFFTPSQRFFAWHPVTHKRVVEDQFPNITLTLQDVRLNEVLADIDRRPELVSKTLMFTGESLWAGYDAGESVLAEGVPDPGRSPKLAWGIYPFSQLMIWTWDKSGINNVFDMDGKRVSLGANPEDFTSTIYQALFETAGVKPRIVVTTEHGADGIPGGSFDAASAGTSMQLIFGPDWHGFANAHTIRGVDFDKEIIEQTRASHPEWTFMSPVRLCTSAFVAANPIGYSIISEDYVGSMSLPGDNCIASSGGNSVAIWAFDDVDEEAMYALTRSILDNSEEFQLTFPGAPFSGAIWAERSAHFAASQSVFHPGAARAYEEAGQTYGSEGVVEWEARFTDPVRWWLDFLPSG